MQEVAPRPSALVLTDRDGTLIRDVPYLSRLEDIALLPGVAKTIRTLNRLEIPVVVVTNQSGVARGYFSEAFVRDSHDRINAILAGEGARVDLFLYCPHLAGVGIAPYDMDCTCRKPRSGMLKRALEEFSLLPERAMMVGDSLRDVEAAADLGIAGYLISSGIPSSATLSTRIVSSFSAAVEDFLTEKNLLLPERSPHVS